MYINQIHKQITTNLFISINHNPSWKCEIVGGGGAQDGCNQKQQSQNNIITLITLITTIPNIRKPAYKKRIFSTYVV